MATRKTGLRAGGAATREEYEAYIKSLEWRARRELALAAAGHRCQVCYSPDDLDVHHRTYRRFRHEAPSDLTVLCSSCHALFHGRPARRTTDREWVRREKWLLWGLGEIRGALSDTTCWLSFEAEYTGRGGHIVRRAIAWEDRVMKRLWKELSK